MCLDKDKIREKATVASGSLEGGSGKIEEGRARARCGHGWMCYLLLGDNVTHT